MSIRAVPIIALCAFIAMLQCGRPTFRPIPAYNPFDSPLVRDVSYTCMLSRLHQDDKSRWPQSMEELRAFAMSVDSLHYMSDSIAFDRSIALQSLTAESLQIKIHNPFGDDTHKKWTFILTPERLFYGDSTTFAEYWFEYNGPRRKVRSR